MEQALAAFAAEPLIAAAVLLLVLGLMSLPWIAPILCDRMQDRALERAQKNFNLPMVPGQPMPADVVHMERKVAEELDQENWEALGQKISELTDSQALTSDGQRAYDVVIDRALRPIDEAETDSALRDALVPYNSAMRRFPHVPGLVGLYLRALQKAAWRARGTYEGRPADPQGLRLFVDWMQEIEDIVKETGRAPSRSILLAEPFYHAAILRDNPAEAMTDRFEQVLHADNGNARIWAERSHHLLPGWFGSTDELGAHLARSMDAVGVQMLPLITVAVLPCVRLSQIPGWTEELFISAVEDLSLRDDGQETVNALCSTLFVLGYGRLACELGRRFLTTLHRAAWDSEDVYLLFFDAAFGGKPYVRPTPVAPRRAISRVPAE